MNRILLTATLVSLVGCVSAGRYDQLKADYDSSTQQLATKEHQNTDLKAALDREHAHARDLENQILKLQADLTQQQAETANILKDKSSLQSSVNDMKTALAELQRRKAEADARIAEFKGLLTRFKGLIDAGKLKVKIADGRMVVQLATDVLFPSGSASLSKDGKAAVAEVTQVLASIPERKFQVEGHTDNVPINTAQYHSNWELAAGRSLSVVKTMIDAGMPPDRISAASYGESKPATTNDTPEGKAANRRIEIVVVPDLSSLPGFDQLNRISGS